MLSPQMQALMDKVRADREALGLNFRGASYANKLQRDWGITRALYQGRADYFDADIPEDFEWITPDMYKARTQ